MCNEGEEIVSGYWRRKPGAKDKGIPTFKDIVAGKNRVISLKGYPRAYPNFPI